MVKSLDASQRPISVADPTGLSVYINMWPLYNFYSHQTIHNDSKEFDIVTKHLE